MRSRAVAALAASAMALTGCGFQLRGDPAVGLKTMSISAVGGAGTVTEIRRILATGPTKVVGNPKEAEAQLRILEEKRDKAVHTITASGRVYDFQLRLTVRYEVLVPGHEQPLIEPTEAVSTRLLTYSESAPTAKEAEEQLLYKDMQVDIAGRILRHIAVVRREP
ncbi:MAG TPA: LPS assembly lipoprotein LptE [Usitatibacter sp.]|jgi:LPS-assembly lipoprotein|nr:LPS assembly lipoprotein LptE [Usitatibacter sp.]